MTQVLVRYKIRPEHAAENEPLVRAVYDELRAPNPEGSTTRRSSSTTG